MLKVDKLVLLMRRDLKWVLGHLKNSFLIYFIDGILKCESTPLWPKSCNIASLSFISMMAEGRAFTVNAYNHTTFDYSQQVLHEDPG